MKIIKNAIVLSVAAILVGCASPSNAKVEQPPAGSSSTNPPPAWVQEIDSQTSGF
ncbi:MAG: hypothetical protein H7A46_13565 [Verrucomicrobiales bacterium]|nr:hypothetical protein [Verrucomicrobiales bacterium]